MACTALQVIKYAKSQVGTKEKPAGSNKTKYGRAYGLNGQPWCAIFVWYCYYMCKSTELYYGGKKTAYVPALADYYIKEKRMVKKSKGRLGDIVFFDFDRNGNSDHVGFIYNNLGNGWYITIEGNTGVGNNTNGGMVMYRKRHKSNIRWIARPRYKKVTTTKKTSKKGSQASTKGKTKKYPVLKKGSRGKYVKKLQKLLKIKADGIFGAKTEAAVKKYQKKKKLQADGIVGAKTWAKLLK